VRARARALHREDTRGSVKVSSFLRHTHKHITFQKITRESKIYIESVSIKKIYHINSYLYIASTKKLCKVCVENISRASENYAFETNVESKSMHRYD